MSILLNRWVILAAVVLALIVNFVWRDMGEQMSDSFADLVSADVGPPVLTDQELLHGRGLRLGRLRNNVDELSVSGLRVVSSDGSQRRLAFTLHTDAPNNDYPSLEVRLMAPNAEVLDRVIFAPSEYSHGAVLTTEAIQLDVKVTSNETRAEVRPLYTRASR